MPEAGKLLEVADGVHWIRMPLPFALDHINLWLLRDADGWVIVDSGFGNDATKRLWEEISKDALQGRPVKRIIVTHLHPDHLGLAAWLADRFGVDVWMTQAEFAIAHILWNAADGLLRERQLELFRRHGLDEAARSTLTVHPGAYRRAIPALPATLRRMIAGDTLTVDGRAWRVLIGHGHSPEHASLYCESLGLMISGDMILPKISTNVSVTPFEPDGNPLGLFLDSVKRYGALASDTLILPSHGQVFYGLHPRIQDLHDHHAERFDLVLQACRQPRTAAELLQLLFKRALDAHQLSFAMGEAVAHLNYLMHARQLQRHADASGVYRFTRTAA